MMPDDSLNPISFEVKDLRNKRRGHGSGDTKKRTNVKESRIRQEKMQSRLEQSELTNTRAGRQEQADLEEMQRQHQKRIELEQKKKDEVQRREENKHLYSQDLITTAAGSVPNDLQGKKARIYNSRVEAVQSQTQITKPKGDANQRDALLRFMQSKLD